MPRLADVILRGTTSAQPAANAVAEGSLYFDTVLSTLQRSNGSAWETVSPAAVLGDADYGDIVVSSSGTVFTVDTNAITTAKINNAAVTLAKIANASANSIVLGSGASGSGSPYSEIALGTNLSMSGTTLNATGGSFDSTLTTSQSDFVDGSDTIESMTDLVQAGSNITITEVGTRGAISIASTASGGGTTLSPESIYEFDDFVSYNGTGVDTGKFVYVVGSAPARQASEANHPGITRLSSTGANSMQPNSVGHGFLPDDNFTLTFVIRSNSHTNAAYRLGMSDDAGNPPTNGIYVESLTTDTNWFLVTRASGNQTRVDTGIACSDSTWYKITVRRKDASTIGATVNGGSEVTSTTNIPTAEGAIWMAIATASGTQSLDVDFWSFQDAPSARF